MLEIVLLILSILIGLTVGMFFRKRAIKANDLFCDMKKYIDALQLNVTGKQLELGVFNLEFAQSCSDTFRELLLEKKLPMLSGTQKRTVVSFFDSLDCTSGSQLLQNLQFYEKQIEREVGAVGESVKKSAIYVKLGLLLGAMVGILFL